MKSNTNYLLNLNQFFLNEKLFRQNRRGNLNTHFICNNILLKNIDVYEIMWKNIIERAGHTTI
jgi:hypothetical protein